MAEAGLTPRGSIERRDRPLRVLQVLAPAAFGGLERVVVMLSRGLAEAGHDVDVLAYTTGHSAAGVLTACREAGARVYEVRTTARGYRRDRASLRAQLRAAPYDVAHLHGYRTDILLSDVVRKAGVRLVSTAHGFTGGGTKMQFYEWLQRRSWRKADHVIAVSRTLADLARSAGCDASRIRLLPSRLVGQAALARGDARSKLGIAPDVFVIGWIGRVSWEKGPDVFADAMAALAIPQAEGHVLGSGPMFEALSFASRGTGAKVRWHGFVPDAGHYIRAFDVLAITSRTEGTPITALEAIAAGVPVVTTPVGGIPDLFGSDGAQYVRVDDPAGVAASIAALRSNYASGEAMAGIARKNAGGHDAGRAWIADHVALYSSPR